MRRGGLLLCSTVVWFALASAATATASVKPRAIGQIDCNGYSPIQIELRPTAACADVRGIHGQRFYDNGWYIGHDEPAIRLISNRPMSSADMTFVERLPRDPAQLPTVAQPGHDITHFFELSIAPWFSTSLCDPNSFPQRPCEPESDRNAPRRDYPGAGGAFLELQFYPPGFGPFQDNISCDNSHWCSALNIDSLECDITGACNNDCVEPVNFAWIQNDGVPTGPPSPQLGDTQTITPNEHTLLMDPGDLIVVHIYDAALPDHQRALEITEKDLTNGRSGFMIASAANGFMTTSRANCSGTPFNYQPEYSSAAPANILPWGDGPYNVDTEFEVGHFVPCTSLTDRLEVGQPFPDVVYGRCHGPYEPEAENPNLEPNDAPCFPLGDTHRGTSPPNEVSGCWVGAGDLDYDGTSYEANWPTSAEPGRFPGSFVQAQPTTLGHTYAQIQFETDLAATEHGCNTSTGEGCIVPPPGPGHFYPFWTLTHTALGCSWEFGNVRSGQTFGGDAQYGAVGPTTMAAFISPILPNPSCSAHASAHHTT